MEKTINKTELEQWQLQNRKEQNKQRNQRLQKIEQAATTLAVSILFVGGAVVLIKLGGIMVKDLQNIGV